MLCKEDGGLRLSSVYLYEKIKEKYKILKKGNLSGTDGYLYVPAPWWKTDYFEIRCENPADNRRYFYQLDGEGIRYTWVTFLRTIETGKPCEYVSEAVSEKIAEIVERCLTKRDVTILRSEILKN